MSPNDHTQAPPPPTADNPVMFEEPIGDVPNRYGVILRREQNTLTWPMPVPSGMTRSHALELAAHLIVLSDELVDNGETGIGQFRWIGTLVEKVRAQRGI